MDRTTEREWDKILGNHDYEQDRKNRSPRMKTTARKNTQTLNQVIAMSPTPVVSEKPFTGHLEHLQALEQEATLLLLTYASKKQLGPAIAQFSPEEVAITGITDPSVKLASDYQLCQAANRRREAATLLTDKQLTFLELCQTYKLDEKERIFVLFLLLQATAPSFRKRLEEFGLDEDNHRNLDGLKVSLLLELTCDAYRDQLEARRYFSVDGTLIREDLIEFDSTMYENTNVLTNRVILQDSCIRFCLGDRNLYSGTFKFVRREMGTVRLEQVVLPELIKDEVVQRLETYYRLRSSKEAEALDAFYGYGTGLALLFHGSSGTGKTMLAQALSNHFQRPLFYLTEESLGNMPGGYDDIFQAIFREANMHGGIVFFDEADDIFSEGTSMSRELLIALEKSRCVTILATNKPVEMDPAMERRLSMKIAFSKPDASMRRTIWQTLMPDFIDCDEDIDIADLADEYQFSGGLIKNTLVMAIANAFKDSADKPRLTHEHMVAAAQLQKPQVMERTSLFSEPEQSVSLENLPLSAKDRDQFERLERVCTEAHQQKLPLRFILQSATSLGCEAMSSLATKCGLKPRVINLTGLLRQQDKGKVIDPVTQKEVDVLDVVFSAHCTEDAVLIFNDSQNVASLLFKKDQEDKSFLEPDIMHRLKQFNGLCCLITAQDLAGTASRMFDFSLAIGYPEITRQLAAWKEHLPTEELNEEQLLEIVERHPMQVDEIEVVARRSRYLSFLDSNSAPFDINHLETALSNYHHRTKVPVLFGGNHE